MNAVEIAEAVAELVEQPFTTEEFPYSFLAAFDNPPATIERLKSGTTNNSDVGGVLQRNNIHILTCDSGRVGDALEKLRESSATTSQKAKYILATDGIDVEAEDIMSGETLACTYKDLEEKFGFFLPLANITTVREIRESSFDIKATGRLNKLYVELLKHNPEWSNADKRHDMNHFMARLIFCFFSEDTGIFGGEDLLTTTIEQMSSRDGSDMHVILSDIFKTMNTKDEERTNAGLPRWANVFPYVNGGLFSGSTEVPAFTKIARTYLLHIGKLDWKKINPDVFGSMIQAVANDEERSGLGMHYTSVPNILKVLNPLFLGDLRQQLADAESNARKLLNLRNRIKRIRVFDPACGSGNFLVIAYKEMRSIEAEINTRRGESDRRSEIPITNFRGIELFDFPAEIARLALIIAEYQCDVTHRGQKEALAEFLPLDTKNWITCGNALRLDWLSICPPTGTGVKHTADDLFMSPLDQAEIEFENEGGETYICGNPPYIGSTWQTVEQKEDIRNIFEGRIKGWRSLDYVSGWFMKAADFGQRTKCSSAFVSTNSICQGQQVPILWPEIFLTGCQIVFAHSSFKWANLAQHNAGVTVVIVGLSNWANKNKKVFTTNREGELIVKIVDNINAYLMPGKDIIVRKLSRPLSELSIMNFGNKPVDGGNLLMTRSEVDELDLTTDQRAKFIRQIYGAAELIRGQERFVLWIEDHHRDEALAIGSIRQRVDRVREMRTQSRDSGANAMASAPHQMREMNIGYQHTLAMPCVSSENRAYLPASIINNRSTITNLCYGLFDAPLWNLGILLSKLHLVWISTVCGQLETRIRYSNTMGWNTFPIPRLTGQNINDLTYCAGKILEIREKYFPASLADLYETGSIPNDLLAAHELNDETIERIYVGRRFKNDTERLEKLFSMYTKMTTTVQPN